MARKEIPNTDTPQHYTKTRMVAFCTSIRPGQFRNSLWISGRARHMSYVRWQWSINLFRGSRRSVLSWWMCSFWNSCWCGDDELSAVDGDFLWNCFTMLLWACYARMTDWVSADSAKFCSQDKIITLLCIRSSEWQPIVHFESNCKSQEVNLLLLSLNAIVQTQQRWKLKISFPCAWWLHLAMNSMIGKMVRTFELWHEHYGVFTSTSLITIDAA